MLFGWFAYRSVNPDLALGQILDLMVQRTYAVMSNDVLIAIPLFVFMGYLVERANLIEKLFKSLHLAMARVPGSLAVATIVTCAIFATATGIVGAVVTLMGLLAFPAMLKAGYNVQVGAGSVTAGGCLGILIPPSVLLIVYGATAGVSVVQLYAGAFFPGIMLAALYVGYIIVLAKIKPSLMPPLSQEERRVALPSFAQRLSQTGNRALTALVRGLKGPRNADVPSAHVGLSARNNAAARAGCRALHGARCFDRSRRRRRCRTRLVCRRWVLPEKRGAPTRYQPVSLNRLRLKAGCKSRRPKADAAKGRRTQPMLPVEASKAETQKTAPADVAERVDAPLAFWIVLAICVAALLIFYATFNFARLEIFKMLLASFFPLALLIIAVLGSIVFGLATPSEAARRGRARRFAAGRGLWVS